MGLSERGTLLQKPCNFQTGTLLEGLIESLSVMSQKLRCEIMRYDVTFGKSIIKNACLPKIGLLFHIWGEI